MLQLQRPADFPLTLTVQSARVQTASALSSLQSPWLLLAFRRLPDPTSSTAQAAGQALWAAGVGLLGLLVLGSLLRFGLFVGCAGREAKAAGLPAQGVAAARRARFRRSLRLAWTCGCSAGLACVIAGGLGLALSSALQLRAAVGGGIACILGLVLVLLGMGLACTPALGLGCGAQGSCTSMLGWSKGTGGTAEGESGGSVGVLHVALCVGLSLACCYAVQLDLEAGELGALPGLVVGVALVLLSSSLLWLELRAEHAKL